jgi:repressor LexA|tara:strand:- start:323 stop:592 length:270 start_codon:yes stop_codon:yes gene_type:complete
MIINCNICKKDIDIDENLTKKELKILQFIKKYTEKEGYAPSVREISKGVGIKSLSGVDRYIYSLQKKHYLVKKPYRKRTIILLKEVVCG